MRDITQRTYHPIQEQLVTILRDQTQNPDPEFFRIMTAYFFTKCASMMRTHILCEGRGRIPVNYYGINLASSGAGKGHSVNILEDRVINGFREAFMETTFPQVAQNHLHAMAEAMAIRNPQLDEDTCMDKLKREFFECGAMLFSFDGGTSAAIKQMRYKLQLASIGAMALQMDEIGSNLSGNMDMLTQFLELYDMGKLKQKLTKSTKDNTRAMFVTGATPSNMLLFGTPVKLLDDPKASEQFYELLETGYARRCFFGFHSGVQEVLHKTPQELYDIFTDSTASRWLDDLCNRFRGLANTANFDTTIEVPKDVMLHWLEYRQACESVAVKMSDYDEILKSETRHRYFKAIKLAGAYAFVDGSLTVTEDHLYQAIAMAEDSGLALQRMVRRDKPWTKLAHYICGIGREVTYADLAEDLPFWRGSESQKKDMLTLAIAHGYRNNMIIRKEVVDGIDFYKGSSLDLTDMHKMSLSWSNDITTGYRLVNLDFTDLHKLCTKPGLHWCNHGFKANPAKSNSQYGYREEASVLPGFNMVVLDIDGGISIQTVHSLMQGYTFLLHTTKRCTADHHRFRLIFPLSHQLAMEAKEYKEFMENIAAWLPFEVDTATFQRSRKWETYNGKHLYNDGEPLNALQFIPRTRKAEEEKQRRKHQQGLGNLERWFLDNMQEGNRNNYMLRYALVLKDNGLPYTEIANKVYSLNNRMENPLAESEISGSVLKTVSSRMKTNPES